MFPTYNQPTYVLNVDQRYSDYLEKLNHNGKIPCPLFEIDNSYQSSYSNVVFFQKISTIFIEHTYTFKTISHTKHTKTISHTKQYQTSKMKLLSKWSIKSSTYSGWGDLVKSPINKNCFNCRASNDITMNCITF